MKFKSLSTWLIACVIGAGILLAGCSKQDAGTLYTCSMHPQVIKDKPGQCPICHMDLVPVRKEPATNPATGGVLTNAGAIAIDPVTMQNMNIRIDVVTNGPLRRIVRSVGTVDFDETSLAEVTTKFRGWIEKLYVDTTGQQVHRGEPLFEIYSPELYSAQVEYLLAIEQSTNSGTDSLNASALTKLKFYDISAAQIAELEKTKQPKKALQVTAPRDGIVIEKMAVQGQMVDAGMKLYRLADLATVWVTAQIYEQDLPFVTIGQEALVQLSYLPDREFRGRVTYVYPTLDEKTRTAKVRMEFHNPGYFLKPGMFATIELRAELAASALLVPEAAVLRSGEKNTAFVALDGGKFEPRAVLLGARAENNFYQVLGGLEEGERVVTSGQFMFDSESQSREAIQKMTGTSSRPTAVAQKSATVKTRPPSATGSSTNTAAYICPMPEHVAIRYDHSGNCPICGMMLVPVAEQTLAKLQPGGRVQYYTCPMTDACPTPGHGDIHYARAGRCPVCGMTLIPVMAAPTNSPTPPKLEVPAAKVESKPQTLYACPMHPEEVSDEPGECSKCKMELLPTNQFDKGKISEELWRRQHPTHSPAEHQH